MASLSLSFTSMSLRPPELSSSNGNYGNILRKKPFSVSVAANSPAPPEKPEIELEFIGPKAESDGSYPLETARAISGEKLLRNIMLDNKIELYATYGKVMNCGGGGSCGTCIVEEKDKMLLGRLSKIFEYPKQAISGEIIDGKDLLNERTNTELQYLKKKPESWRLACQTIVGNKENSGKVVVQRIPQRKK